MRANLDDLLDKAKERKASASELQPLSREGIALDLVSAFRGNSMVSTDVLGDLMQAQATMYLKGTEIARRELVSYGVAVSNVSNRVMGQCASLAIPAGSVSGLSSLGRHVSLISFLVVVPIVFLREPQGVPSVSYLSREQSRS